MTEHMDYSPQPEKQEVEKIKFPPITEMYKELGRLREVFNGKAEIELMGKGRVAIDKYFKPLGDKIEKLGAYDMTDGGGNKKGEETKVVTDAIGEMKLQTGNEFTEEELNINNGQWHKDLVNVDKLLHFNFGDLKIVLEGRPVYQITDSNNQKRETIRHLADNQKEAQNPSYIFFVDLKDETSFRVQVNPDGTVKILSPYLENIYKDALTGEETTKSKSTKRIQKRGPVSFEEKISPSLLRKILRIPAKKIQSEREEVWTEKEVFKNRLIGGPREEISLGEDYPEKHQLAQFLTEMLKESIRALKEAEKTAPKAVSVEL